MFFLESHPAASAPCATPKKYKLRNSLIGRDLMIQVIFIKSEILGG
jgi:hypothetical protein